MNTNGSYLVGVDQVDLAVISLLFQDLDLSETIVSGDGQPGHLLAGEVRRCVSILGGEEVLAGVLPRSGHIACGGCEIENM